MKRLLAVACLLALAGCGLPLPGGVKTRGGVVGVQQKPRDIRVLPPGPRDNASAVQEVRDFFGAQSSPDDRHASARAFLAPGLQQTWDDTSPVSVFSGDLGVAAGSGPGIVQVSADIVGRIGNDGSYRLDRVPFAATVHATRTSTGRWVLTSVPDGLLLSTADRDRSFRPRNVYFLAAPTGRPPAPSHLVADPVFVPVTADPADALVRRLLAGPSSLLGNSVSTAFPARTTLEKPVDSAASGLVTVDLSDQVRSAPPSVKERISAQLVWTLKGIPTFSKLRLRSGGKDVALGSTDSAALQDRNDWDSYNPDRLPDRAPAYYLSGRRLLSLDEDAAGVPKSGRIARPPIDLAAASPDGQRLAVVTRTATGAELRTGAIDGEAFTLRQRGPQLSFLSWGSGEQGVWFLMGNRVMLAPDAGPPHEVPVGNVDRFGPITGLRVSRDGARVGLIAGTGSSASLLVGRITFDQGAPRIVGLRSVAPDVHAVLDLAWDSATSLVVLGTQAKLAAAIRVAVDGSSVALVVRVTLVGAALQSIAAAPGRPLVVGALVDRQAPLVGQQPALFRDNGQFYAGEGPGYAPFYPG
ncbi:MAG: hypothetical protein QOE84_3072 [Actinomycetota bacterium]|nr:hypothetical protein [Actinomycetota bacterium]